MAPHRFAGHGAQAWRRCQCRPWCLFRGSLFDLGRENRVELINGRIYRMSPQNDPHILVMSKLIRAINPVASPSDWVIFQSTVRLDKYSAPDPDMTWLSVPMGTPSAKW